MSVNNQEEQVNSIFEAILGLAQLDYSNKAIITDSGSQIDAIASGVNMLSERLEYLVNKLGERTELLMNSEKISQLGSWQLDIVSNRLTWSDEVYRIFGLQPQGFAATNEAFFDAVHPDDRAAVHAAYSDSVRAGKDGYEIEHRVQRNNGEIRYVFEKCHHESDASGNITRSVGFVQDITQRKQAEQAIQQSEIHLNAAQQMAKIGSWELDFETGKIVCSDEMYNVFNCDPEIFTPHVDSLINLLPNECRETLNNWIAKSSLGIPQPSINYFIYNADGSIKYLKWQGEVIFNKEGKPIKANGTVQDITESKQAEENLLNSLKEVSDYKYALDESSIVAITDSKGIIKQINDNFCKISGYSREELIGQNHRIINSGNHPKEFIRDLWVTIANGKVWKGEIKNKAKDGTFYWVDTTIVPFLNERGKPYQYLSIRSDITQQKEQENEIKQFNRDLEKRVEEKTIELIKAESDFKKILDNLMEGAQIIDFDMRCIYVNDTFVKYANYSREELLGYTPMEKYPGFEQTEIFKFYQKCINERIPLNFESEFTYPDGTKKWFDIKLNPIPEGFFMLVFDISERKKNEEKLEQQNKELAVSNKELEQFAYVASHDLQEPLRMVTNFLKLLEKRMEGQLNDTNKQYIHFAVDGAIRMKTLIQDLLLYSRVGTNKESFAATNLNEVMLYVIQLLEGDIKKNQALITVKPMPVIGVNKTLICQLFVNLVSNALKYHHDKQPEIEVGCKEDPGKWVFYIKDNGIGIDPKYFDKIFAIFQRLHNRDEYSGTGIGLAICKKIAEIHKGKIWVESELGQGSTFYFSIPKQNA